MGPRLRKPTPIAKACPDNLALICPGCAMHVTQRGVNRCAIFADETDRQHYRRLLREAAKVHGVAVHAFVLMDNHVHLLLTSSLPGSLSHAMRKVGQNYVQAFNARHGRSGTLWQGRFKSCLIDSDRYLLTVIRYIELNPVRAALVEKPEDSRWSSVHTHLGNACDPLITPHPLYLALGPGPTERQSVRTMAARRRQRGRPGGDTTTSCAGAGAGRRALSAHGRKDVQPTCGVSATRAAEEGGDGGDLMTPAPLDLRRFNYLRPLRSLSASVTVSVLPLASYA